MIIIWLRVYLGIIIKARVNFPKTLHENGRVTASVNFSSVKVIFGKFRNISISFGNRDHWWTKFGSLRCNFHLCYRKAALLRQSEAFFNCILNIKTACCLILVPAVAPTTPLPEMTSQTPKSSETVTVDFKPEENRSGTMKGKGHRHRW